MIIRFSVQESKGTEIYLFEPTEYTKEVLIDRDVIKEFMRAFQGSSSADTETIHSVLLSGLILYFKDYEKFSLRLLVNQKITNEEIEIFFENVSKEIKLVLKDSSKGHVVFEEINKKLEPILSSFLYFAPFEEKFTRSIPKVALIGLGSAGKTSIIYRFFDNWSSEMARNLQATIGMEISQKFQEFTESQIIIMDFGGQDMFREEYLSNSRLWADLSSLIFVVDIQDGNSFEIAKVYLSQVWKLVSKNNGKGPKLSIFFHKYDPMKRNELKENLAECLNIFNDFAHLSSFSLTSIEDSSSNAALLNTLYFSLPEIILPRLLKREFFFFFDKIVSHGLVRHFKDLELDILSEREREKWIRWAEMQGISCGLAFQKSWLDYLTGNALKTPNPPQLQKPSRSIEIVQDDQSFFLIIPNSHFSKIPYRNFKHLFHGFLNGVLKTFRLSPAKIVEENELQTKWVIDLEIT